MKNNIIQYVLDNKKMQYKISAGIVFLTYIIIYYIFLKNTDFLPYVFDNNETFSNLMHAQNMYNFGFKYTFGLTDEAFAILKEAHPYVYTHQGNFPRLYSFILYCLGAKSAESQIFITTFTIGLAGMGFCCHYFAKYVSCVFATIFCLLLMTDYVMFMQWQVNTWRVWHLFFFFSSLLCCHGLNGKNRKSFIAASILNFSCLFYMETAFALFVFFSSNIYLILSYKNPWKRNFLNLFIFSSGALLGMGILLVQNIAFLGWDIFLQDLSYTFISRNQLSLSNKEITTQVIAFYAKQKIAFWQNFNTIQGVRNPILIFKNFYRHCLLPYTPLVTLAALITMLGTLTSYFYAIASKNRKLFYFFNSIQFKPSTLKILLTASFLISLLTLSFASYPTTWHTKELFIEFTKPFSLGSFLILNLLFLNHINKFLNKKTPARANFVILLTTYFLLSALLSLICLCLNRFSVAIVASQLQMHSLSALGGTSSVPLIMGAILLFNRPYFSDRPSGSNNLKTFKKILPFWISTLIGFLCAYLILPGYIISGYWWRSCCFTIFFHIGLYAWLFYILWIKMIAQFSVYLRNKTPFQVIEKNLASTDSIVKLSSALFLLFFFTYSWISLQNFYTKEFPSSDFRFLQLFKQWPFHNKTIVSNMYGAPLSFASQNWAYLDPIFGNSLRENRNDSKGIHKQFQRDLRYLWLADAGNSQYKHPELFTCWINYNFEQVGGKKPMCGEIPIVQFARNHTPEETDFIELAHDKHPRDRWSIIDFNNGQGENKRISINFLSKYNQCKRFLATTQNTFIDYANRNNQDHEKYTQFMVEYFRSGDRKKVLRKFLKNRIIHLLYIAQRFGVPTAADKPIAPLPKS